MAGLGAYGGAGLGAGLETAGLQAEVAAGLPSVPVEGLTPEQVDLYKSRVIDARQAAIDKFGGMSMGDKLSSGIAAATDQPMNFLSKNAMPLAAAAAPIMAGQMVPTTTKMPENTNPAYIRQKLFDPYTHTYKSLAPVRADQWGTRNFSDAYTNPQTGIAATVDPNSFKPMASGGIVALADGGVPGYADGMLVGDQDVFNYFKGLDQSKLASGALDSQIAADMQKYNVSAADIARITGTQANQGDYEKRFVQAIAKPDVDTSEFMAATKDVGLQNQALANALQSSGLSAASQYALTHQDIGPAANAAEVGGGLEGLSNNINYLANLAQGQIGAGTLTAAQARENALTEMNKIGRAHV